jgi:hypothetical protein
MPLGDRLGWGGLILALLGIAVAILWPDKKWIGWLSLCSAGVLLVAWGWMECGGAVVKFDRNHQTATSYALVAIIGAVLFCGAWFLLGIGSPKKPVSGGLFVPLAPNPESKSVTAPQSEPENSSQPEQPGKSEHPHARAMHKSAPAEPHSEPLLTFLAYLQPEEPYSEGTILAGIVWQKNYMDTRLDIANGVTIKNLDFTVGLDTSIASIGQISQFPGITAFPAKSLPPGWLTGTDLQGNPMSIPIAPSPGTFSIAPAYRVHCSEVFANTVIHLVIASIAVNPIQNGQLPQQLFAPRRAPKIIRIKGTYETHNGNSTESHDVNFSYEFKQPQ